MPELAALIGIDGGIDRDPPGKTGLGAFIESLTVIGEKPRLTLGKRTIGLGKSLDQITGDGIEIGLGCRRQLIAIPPRNRRPRWWRPRVRPRSGRKAPRIPPSYRR